MPRHVQGHVQSHWRGSATAGAQQHSGFRPYHGAVAPYPVLNRPWKTALNVTPPPGPKPTVRSARAAPPGASAQRSDVVAP
jgi:hypothetical protein